MTNLPTKAAIEAARIEANKEAAFAAKVQRLLGHIGQRQSAQSLTVAYKTGITADAYALSIAVQQPVGAAVHALKAQAVEAAAQAASRVIDRVMSDLEAKGWDINAAAPYLNSFNTGREAYQRAANKRSLYSRLTKSEGYSYSSRSTAPKIVEPCLEGQARFIAQSEQDAALQYDMFIIKLVSKVGEVTGAELNGSHVWSHSILTTITATGETVKWKTQQILNYSVLGTPYYQWPTRIVK